MKLAWIGRVHPLQRGANSVKKSVRQYALPVHHTDHSPHTASHSQTVFLVKAVIAKVLATVGAEEMVRVPGAIERCHTFL
jgi:hypothetical protein